MADRRASAGRERAAALFYYLAEQDLPVGRDEVLRDLSTYYRCPEDPDDGRVVTPSSHDQLLRDVTLLADLGAPVEWTPKEDPNRRLINPTPKERQSLGTEYRWRVQPRAFLRREPRLDPDQAALLGAALALFAPGTSSLVEGLGHKLGIEPSPTHAAAPSPHGLNPEEWRTLVDAHDDRHLVQCRIITHTEGEHTVVGEPWGVIERRDTFYLVLREDGHEQPRAVRTDRIMAGSIARAKRGDRHRHWHPDAAKVERLHAEMRALTEHRVVTPEGEDRAIEATHDDAAVGQAIRDGVVHREPALRAEQRRRLEHLRRDLPPEGTDDAAPCAVHTVAPEPGLNTRRTNRRDLALGLEVVMRVAEAGAPLTLPELGEEFGLSPDRVESLLHPWARATDSLQQEAAPWDGERGLVLLDEGPPATVRAVGPAWLGDHTLYLRLDEVSALKVGLDHLRETGSAQRATVIDELLRALDLPEDRTAQDPRTFVHLDDSDQRHLPRAADALTDAVNERWVRLSTTHWAQPRVVAPLQVARAGGAALVCVAGEGEEPYWVEADRITSVEVLDRAVEETGGELPPPSHRGGGVTITIDVGPSALWAVDVYGMTVCTDQPRTGVVRATKPVRDEAAGARIALRLAGQARVVAPDAVREEAHRRAEAMIGTWED